jgi:hypothetical protein
MVLRASAFAKADASAYQYKTTSFYQNIFHNDLVNCYFKLIGSQRKIILRDNPY